VRLRGGSASSSAATGAAAASTTFRFLAIFFFRPLSLSLTKTKLPTSADAHRSTIAARNCEDECGGGQQKEQQQQTTVIVNLGFLLLGFR